MEFHEVRSSNGGTPEGNLAGENALAGAAAAQGRGVVLLPDANNVVVLPAGATLDDLSVQGRDILVTMPDGRVFVIPEGAIYVPQIVIGDVAVPPLNLAALLTGNEPQPAAGPVQSSGGNFADPTGPIQAAYGLGDLLPYTELSFPVQQEQEVLPQPIEEDNAPEVLIQAGDGAPASRAATDSVDEAGLAASRLNGNQESAGSSAGDGSDGATGTIIVTSVDGVGSITINGVLVTGVAGQQIQGTAGVLTLGALNGNQIAYTYALADNTAGDASTDQFTVVITDSDGDTATATLTLDIVDDVPTARADTDTVPADDFSAQTGNVLTGAGTTSGAAGVDTAGADGASVTGIRAGASGDFSGIGTSIAGQFGTLTISGDGAYSYARTPGAPGGVTDVFTYQITDGDGDVSSATLTISVGNSLPSIPEIGDGTQVNENQLPATTDTRSQESPGSQFVSGPETTTGTITFHSADGVSTVSLGGTVITPGSLPQVVTSDGTGTLTVVGYAYDPVTGDGSVTYTYTLTDNTANTDGSTVSFDITVVDADGDAVSDTLDIHIVDDVPSAADDSAVSVAEDVAGTIGGNVLANDTQGADGASVTSVTIGGTAYAIAASGTTSVSAANGAYTFDAAGNWTFDPATGLDQSGGDIDASFTYTLTDGDGDIDTALQPITITDGAAPSAGTPISLSVDDENLADGSNPAAPVTDAGDIVFTPGSDAIATIAFGTDLTGLDAGLSWVRVDGSTITGSDGATLIVTLTLTRSGDTATVTATLLDNYDAHPGINADDLKALGSVDVIATDIDGDTATSSVSVSVSDDMPSAADDSASQASENTAFTIAVFGNDTFGADGVDVADAGKVFVSSQASQGTVTYDAATGLFTYTPNAGAGSASTEDNFEYTIVDGDGDTSTATVTVALQPDSEPQGSERVATLDDDGLSGGNPAAAAGDIDANVDDDPADTSEASFTGTLDFDVGNDTPATITFDASLDGSTATIGLETVTYSLSGNVLTATVTGGTRDNTPLFQIEILDGQTGDYQVTLLTNVLNAGGSNNEAQNAFASIDFTVTDSDGDTATTNLGIVFNDDVPSAAADTGGVIEGESVSGDVVTNDVPGADGLAASPVGAVTGIASLNQGTSQTGVNGSDDFVLAGEFGTLTLNRDGSYTYQSNANAITGAEQDVFEYTIVDSDGDTSTATLTIDLTNVTLVADNQSKTVDEAALDLTADDRSGTVNDDLAAGTVEGSDPSADTETVSGALNVVGATSYALVGSTAGAFGQIQVNSDGTYTYTLTGPVDGDTTTPAQGGNNGNNTYPGNGVESFTYEATDADGNTVQGTITISIVDDVPSAADDGALSVAEDAAGTIGGNVLANDTQGADGASVTSVTIGGTAYAIAAAGTTSVSTANGAYTFDAAGNWTFDPATGLDQSGGDIDASFTYTLTDGDGDIDTALQPITITDGAEPSAGTPISLSVDDENLADGSNPAAPVTDAGDIVFTQGSDAIATIAFGTDLTGLDAGLSWVRVDGSTITGSDGGTLIVTLTLTRSGDTATVTATLSDNYDAHPDITADDLKALGSVDVIATDIDGDTATSSVSVSVSDDVPTAEDDVSSLTENTASVGGNVLTNDEFGADGAHPSEQIVAVSGSGAGVVGGNTAGTYGTLQLNLNGSYTYVLNTAAVQGLDDGEQVTDTFSYTIKDSDGDTSTAYLTVTIDGANDAPLANDDTNWVLDVTSGANPTTAGNVLDNVDHAGAPSGSFADVADTDVDVEPLTVSAVTGGTVGNSVGGSHGSIVINANGSYTYTLNASDSAVNALAAGETLTDSFTYTVSDGTATDTATITITIFGTNDAPVVTGSAVAVSEEGLTFGNPDDSPVSPDDADTTNSVTASGSITITDADTGDTHTVALGMPGQTLYTPDGVTPLTWVLSPDGHTLTGYSADINDPEILVTIGDSGSYTVALGGPVRHLDTTTEDLTSFVIPVTVDDGTTTTTLSTGITVTIEDDSPIAVNDTDTVLEGNSTAGNVLQNSDVGGDSTPVWPDGMITGIASVNLGTSDITADGSGNFVLTGEFGTLTLNRNGGYTYQATANAITASDQDVFTFTMVDADGDPSTATLTINVLDVTLVADNQTKQVDEAALDTVTSGSDLGHGTVTGNNSGSTAETVTGTLSVTSPTGVTYVPQSVSTAYGLFELNSSGAYTYTLINPYTTTPDANDGAVVEPAVETFTYTAQDVYGNTITGTVTIDVKDDVPDAVVPSSATVVNGAAPVSAAISLDADLSVADNYGADGAGTVRFPSSLDGSDSGLTHNFVPIIYQVVSDTVLEAYAGAVKIFTVTLDPTNATYTVDMDGTIDSVQDIDFNAGGYNFAGGNLDWNGFVPVGEVLGGTSVNNNSQDLLLTPAVNGNPDSTVNTTANTGGIGGGSSVGNGETFRIDFVTDLTGNPQSTGGGDYDTASKRDHTFDGHYTVNGAVALFKSSSGSTVNIAVFDDPDGNTVVGDGVADTITGISIIYRGVQYEAANGDTLIVPTTTATTYTVSGHDFTVTLLADGSVNVAGVEGDSGSDMDGTQIAVFTANGYNSVEYTWAGENTFQIGDFGASTLTTDPVSFTIPVEVVDADGDTAQANLSITAVTATPPVALDLDGDGVEFVGLDAGVVYDYGDGLVQTAWVAPDDGLLARDTGSGLDITFADDAEGAETDLVGLRLAYDSNGDGHLTAADADFGDFGVWQDANSNGAVDTGEFKSLLAMGITSVELTASGPGSVEADGDVIVHGTGQYTMNGATYALADVSFATANADRIAARTTEIAAVSFAAAGFMAGEAAHAQPLPPVAAEVVAAALQTFEMPAPEIAASLPDASDAAAPATLLGDQAPQHQQAEPESHSGTEASDQPAQDGLSELVQQDFAPEPLAAVDDGPAPAGAPAFSFGGLDAGLMQALLLAIQNKQAAASDEQTAADLPAVHEAIADSAGQQAIDALIDHFAGQDGSHIPESAGQDNALAAMLAGTGGEGLHAGMAAGFEMAAMAAAVEAHSVAIA